MVESEESFPNWEEEKKKNPTGGRGEIVGKWGSNVNKRTEVGLSEGVILVGAD